MRPLILIDPQPRGLDEIFEPKVRAELESLGELAVHEDPAACRPSDWKPFCPRWRC